MKPRWPEIIAVLVVAVWLALFAMACPPPQQPPPQVESSSSGKKTSSDAGPPLEQPGADMEQQAGQSELPPTPQDIQPIEPEMHHGAPHMP